MLDRRGLLSLFCLASTICIAQPAKKSDQITIIHAAHMLDGVSKSTQGPVTVTIANGRIKSVQSGTQTLPGAEVIELGDATLLPGLIDTHKHMNAPQTGLNPFQTRLTISSTETAIGATATARKLLEEGFTTVRSMGSANNVDLALKRSIDRGWIIGPRIFVALEALGPSAGHSDPRNGIDSVWVNQQWSGGVIDGPVEAMKQVREHKRRGAYLIKDHALRRCSLHRRRP
jgi:imidazolonepropionase-like amidohydrolase